MVGTGRFVQQTTINVETFEPVLEITDLFTGRKYLLHKDNTVDELLDEVIRNDRSDKLNIILNEKEFDTHKTSN
jgi:hypothetical protein